MDTKVDPLGVEPGEEGRVSLQLPERLGCIDPDVKAEHHCVALSQDSSVVGDGSNILVNVVTSRDVRFFGNGNAVRRFVDREDVVVGIGLLKMLKELVEERLDGGYDLFYPLKKESEVGDALNEMIRSVGIPKDDSKCWHTKRVDF